MSEWISDCVLCSVVYVVSSNDDIVIPIWMEHIRCGVFMYGLYVVLNYVCTRQCVIQLSCYMNKCCIIQVSSSNLRHTNIRHILNLTDNNDDNNRVGMEWIYNFNSDTITVWIRLLPSLPAHVGRCNNSQLFGRFVLMYRRVNEMSIKLIILMDFDWSRLACGKCGVCGWCFI